MQLFRNYITLLAAFLCIAVSSTLYAKIIWEKELVADQSTQSCPITSCLSKSTNGIIVMSAESLKGSFPSLQGDIVLWEVGSGGNATRIEPKDLNGKPIKANRANFSKYGCAIASDNLGNLLSIGLLDKLKEGQKVGVVSRSSESKATISPGGHLEIYSVEKLIPLHDDTFALVGDVEKDGLFLQIGSNGKLIQERIFDKGFYEKFTDVTVVDSEKQTLAVTGSSLRVSTQNSEENSADNFVLLYDSNLREINKDYFRGEVHLLFPKPKVCCAGNDMIIVVYRKGKNDAKTRLVARCYTDELKFLWQKEVFSADKEILAFDLAPRPSGFVVGTILENRQSNKDFINFSFFDKEGAGNSDFMYKGKAVIGLLGFNVMDINGETIAVFKEATAGSVAESESRTKVITLD